jgi:hypothetical protein
MQLLAALLALDAVLHALVIIKYGLKDKTNLPFFVFMFVDAILAVVVFLRLPYALWATLLLSAFGLIGLTVTFKKPQREKTIDKAIWVVDLAVVVWAAYLLWIVPN